MVLKGKILMHVKFPFFSLYYASMFVQHNASLVKRRVLSE